MLATPGWRQGQQPAAVLVRDDDDALVLRDVIGRSRRIALRSVVRFRATDAGCGLVDLRDGSTVLLFAAGEPGPGFDERRHEIAELIGRLAAIHARRKRSPRRVTR